MLLKGNVLGCHRPQRRSQCHTRARLDSFVILPRRTRLRQNNLQSSRGTERLRQMLRMRAVVKKPRWPHLRFFSAAAALRARSETAGTTSPQLKAGRSPPQCCRAPLDALLCREVPKRTNTGRNLSLSAQNSPRTASQRVIFNPQYAKVVIFACEPTRTGFLSKWELELESNPYGCRREFNRNSRIFAVISCAVRPIPIPT